MGAHAGGELVRSDEQGPGYQSSGALALDFFFHSCSPPLTEEERVPPRKFAVRRLAEQYASPSAPPAAPAVSPVVPGEVGITGTVNWSGRLHTEANTQLQWEKAYGRATGVAWGEWEKLERTDHKVSTALDMLVAPIRDAHPKCEPPEEWQEEADDAELERMNEVCEFVQDALTRWMKDFKQTLEQIVQYGCGYGFSLHEIVWGFRPDERVPAGTAVYIERLAQRLPSSVDTNGWLEENGELAFIKQSGIRNGQFVQVLLPVDKVLLCTWKRSGNNYQGFSAFRAGWYMAQIRAELLKMMAIGAEREALGVPVAELEKDVVLTDAQRDELQEILESLVYHENAGIQLPPGVKLNWVFSAGANKGNLLEMWRALGVAMLELVQAQQQDLGTADTGSRSVGEVHERTRNAFAAGVRAWVENCMQSLVVRLVDLNFGPQDVYPCFKLRTETEETKGTMADLKALVDSKVIHPTIADENMLRGRFGLEEISQEDYDKAREVPAQLRPPGQPMPGEDMPEDPGEEKKMAERITITLD